MRIVKPLYILSAIIIAACLFVNAGYGIDLEESFNGLIASHSGQSGAYVFEKDEESLLARAWLTEHAAKAIDIQYFIWSTDNIGTLAAETLLKAAERGVHVRVIVDDLLIDAPHDMLLALALHPMVNIRIYNPKHSVGTSTFKRIFNILTDFRGINQRMHDKTFTADGLISIIGGRNMADEYFDYDHEYNFRDRDIVLIGPVVSSIQMSFGKFWESPLSVPVEILLKKEITRLSPERIADIYAGLHAYAADPENYSPDIREAVKNLPDKFQYLLKEIVWDDVRFISDMPGKNLGNNGLKGGSTTTDELVKAVSKARKSITIQSPYLVMPEGGLDMFKNLIQNGVDVRISTNSLASTDNLQAFSGYSKQRKKLLKAGIHIYEFRPDSVNMKQLIERYKQIEQLSPVFAIHAKTMVIDGETLFVGTYNLDPRSANLNTEAGILIRNKKIAEKVEGNIENDMLPENSWNAGTDSPDSFSPPSKRIKLRLWKILPLNPLL